MPLQPSLSNALNWRLCMWGKASGGNLHLRVYPSLIRRRASSLLSFLRRCYRFGPMDMVSPKLRDDKGCAETRRPLQPCFASAYPEAQPTPVTESTRIHIATGLSTEEERVGHAARD